MKIALSSAGFSEYSAISSSLGKCPNFIIYDFETKSFDSLENVCRLEDKSTGPKAIKMLKSNGIDHLITWHIGHNAYNQAQLSGVEVYLCQEGEIVRDALYKYFNNELSLLESLDSINNH